jgi:integrase
MTTDRTPTKERARQFVEKALAPNVRPKAAARGLIEAALALEPRGELLNALREALKVATDKRITDLTDADYRALRPGGKLVDRDRPGLMMRHGKRLGRVWIFRFGHPDTFKQVEQQFARYPATGLADARTIWRALRDQRNAGNVPMVPGETQINNKTNTGIKTMSDLCRKFITDYGKKVKRSWAEDEALLTKHVIPHYGGLPIEAFDYKVVAAILASEHERAPRTAEKLRAVISTMFNVARGRTRKISTLKGPWIAPDHPNPAEVVTLPERHAENHKPSREEMVRFTRGLDSMGIAGDVLRLQAQTAARIAEVAGVPWAEVDLVDGVWHLPKERAKNATDHKVMLSVQSLGWLKARRVADPEGQWVFPSPKGSDKPIRSDVVQKTLKRRRPILQLPDAFTSHSLRHAVVTWLAEQGAPIEIRNRLTNHLPGDKGSQSDRNYNAAKLNAPARGWLQRWVDHLTALEANNVVEIGELHA